MVHPHKIELSREDLYNRVWSTPMSKLCKDFGLSDKGLAKICLRHQIPLPGGSYWRRVQLGQTPPKIPLAKLEEEFPVELPKPKPVFLWPEPPKVSVPLKLSNPHPLIIRTRDSIEGKFKIKDVPSIKIMGGLLAISVSKKATPRALRIMDTIIKEIEKRGGSAEVKDRDGTYLTINGQSFKIHLHEFTKRIEHVPSPNDKPYQYYPRYEFLPTGELYFKIDAHQEGLTDLFKDVKKTKLEDRVGEIIRNLELFADKYAEHAKERIKEEARSRERYQRDYEEKQKIERLNKEMEQWEKTRRIKRYLRNLSKDSSSNIEWLSWISDYLKKRETANREPDSHAS